MEAIKREKEIMEVEGLVANTNNRIEVTSTATTLQLTESNFSNAEYVTVGELLFELSGETYRVVGRGNVHTNIIDIPTEYNNTPVTEIKSSAFYGDSNLTKINIPSSITFIGPNAFGNCENLASVNFYLDTGDDLKISNGAFSGCTALSSIAFPMRLTTIGDDAFNGCTNLNEVYHSDVKDNRLTRIGARAFANCTGLTQVLLTTGLQEIKAQAFENCSALHNFNFVSTITEIGYEAFRNCLALESFTLPTSLTLIGMNAFRIDPDAEGAKQKYIAFADPYTWFTSTSSTNDYTQFTKMDPTHLYDANDSSITSGANRLNGSRLSLPSDGGNFSDRWWHKLKQMPTPEISLKDGVLNMTDPLGVAEHFYIYVNGKKKVTIDV